jgi:hypothetical protein
MDRRGQIIPSQSVLNKNNIEELKNSTWFILQMQFERKENRFSEELLLFKKKLFSEKDPERKEALAFVYANEIENFQRMKMIHHNKVESLKRINKFQEIAK